MLMGAFFGAFGADKTGSWVLGLVIAVAAGAVFGLAARAVRDHASGPTRSCPAPP